MPLALLLTETTTRYDADTVSFKNVPDVGRDNLVKWERVVLLLQLVAQKLRLDRELTANSIFL